MTEIYDASRVLIVDDHANNRAVFDYAVRSLGLETDTAADGREAIRQLSTNDYGLVLLDYHLPHLDGADVLRWMNAELEPRPPVIVVTADVCAETTALFRALGCDGFATKPFVLPELLEQITTLITHGMTDVPSR